MRWPQILMIVWFGVLLGGSLVEHGKTETSTCHFGRTVVAVAIYVALLWWGGFWG
jgi:hypothetical protein